MTEPRVREIERRLREEIENGALPARSQLPTRAQMAEAEQVAESTISLVIRRLREAGYVRSDPTGVYVTELGERTITVGQERVRLVSEGRFRTQAERFVILSAELTDAGDAVASALGVPPGAQVIRRERIATRPRDADATPIAWSVSWLAGTLAEVAPELTAPERIPGGTVGLVAARTGRLITSGADRLHARGALPHEADALAIPAGLPVLVGRTTWSDSTGAVVEVGDWVLPPGREVVYAYDVDGE
jgi:DNA-binding GntR family transcriptional regulator